MMKCLKFLPAAYAAIFVLSMLCFEVKSAAGRNTQANRVPGPCCLTQKMEINECIGLNGRKSPIKLRCDPNSLLFEEVYNYNEIVPTTAKYK